VATFLWDHRAGLEPESSPHKYGLLFFMGLIIRSYFLEQKMEKRVIELFKITI